MRARFRDSEAVCRQAIDMARAAGAAAEEGHALNTLGCCRAGLGHHDEGIALVEQARVIAEKLRSPEDINRAMSNLSSLLYRAGRLEETVQLVVGQQQEGEALGGVVLQSAAMNTADALIDLGRWEEAEAIFGSIGGIMGNCTYHPPLARSLIAVRRGELDGVADALGSVDEATRNLEDVQFRASLLLRQADLALEEGRYDDADAQAAGALALIADSDDAEFGPEACAAAARALADRADGALAKGVPVDAAALRRRADGVLEQNARFVARATAAGGAIAPRAAASAAIAEAEATRLVAADPAAWARAEDRWQRLGHPFELAYCRYRRAQALLASRAGRGLAERLLLDAWEACDALGAGPLRGRIEALAQRAGISLEVGEPDRRAAKIGEELGLTPREVEVLRFLVAHRTDAQIAGALYISKKTASVHVSNILRKLGAANRIEAGEIGRSAGLAGWQEPEPSATTA